MEDEIWEVLGLVAEPLRLRYKLINGESKLVLNSGLLFKINLVVDVIINESVDIILSDENRKFLQLLLNLLNNVPQLVITQRSAESFEKTINLSKFKRLRYLELNRVCLPLVTGLDSLKTQLDTFICNRCTQYNGILCRQKELEWPELKNFNLSYMKLDSTSSSFFMNKPWIKVLNLSYNKLTVINGLEYLEHLVVAIFSYNHLHCIPTFSKSAEKKLELLVLNNNYLTSLAGIEKLSAVKFIDIRYNFISSKNELFYLSGLKKLHTLNFAYNPISSIKFFNIYVSASLSNEISKDMFLLNGKHLSNLECSIVGVKFGICKHGQPSLSHYCQPSLSNSCQSSTNEIPAEPSSKYRRPGKRISKPRDVVIEEVPSEVNFEEMPESLPKQDVALPMPEFSDKETYKKESVLMEHLAKLEVEPQNIKEESLNKFDHNLEPNEEKEVGKKKIDLYTEIVLNKEKHKGDGFQDSDVETTTLLISATVHASDSCYVGTQNITDEHKESLSNELGDLGSKSSDTSECYELHGSVNSKNTVIESNDLDSDQSQTQNIEPSQSIFKLSPQNKVSLLIDTDKNDPENLQDYNLVKGLSLTDEGDEIYYSDIEDEVFWQVQSVDKASGRTSNIILVLSDDELKERCTKSSRTIARWRLEKIQSCVKTKFDPVTIELEFETMKKDKQFRTYIMEYPDAQVLLKKVYSVLETKPLSSMNQRTYACIKCDSYFVRNKPCAFKSKDTQISCPNCSSTLVVEVEEPKLPEIQPPVVSPISHSSSQSSIGKHNFVAEVAACTEWKSPCSATSIEQNYLINRRLSGQRYESDIEVISNPSQSSIEVLGENSRSVTPRRKISTEEKSVNAIIPSQLTTVIEVSSPLPNLTESSSSGSLTESVLTAYEAHNNNRKTIIPEGTLAEEVISSAPENEILSGEFEEEKPTSVWRRESEVYSFSDFTDVDPRIKLFLYQNLFQDDNEALLLLVKCHLWKTGGSDFDGCAVFSTSKVYFLSHSKTDFKDDICKWLSVIDTFNIKDIKEISPMLWQQGAQVQIKHISYLILLMDQERTSNLFKHMRGFLTDVKIQNNVKSNFNLSLQQAVLCSSSTEKSSDPSVNAFTICLSITILKDEVEDEVLRLGSLTLTSGEFHLLPGDLSWLSSSGVPSIIISQDISNLIEVERGKYFVNLHFLDEKGATEEVWSLKLISEAQVSYIVKSIQIPWELMFSETLDVTVRP